MAVDSLGDAFGTGPWKDQQKFLSQTREARVGVVPVLLVKPVTYMNNSGDAVRKLVTFYKLDAATQIIVVSDDIDLFAGDVRFRASGGPGTHNGLKSIVDALGEKFPRIRIGLGAPAKSVDLAAWVLSTMTAEEAKKFEECNERIPEIIRKFVMEGTKESEE